MSQININWKLFFFRLFFWFLLFFFVFLFSSFLERFYENQKGSKLTCRWPLAKSFLVQRAQYAIQLETHLWHASEGTESILCESHSQIYQDLKNKNVFFFVMEHTFGIVFEG